MSVCTSNVVTSLDLAQLEHEKVLHATNHMTFGVEWSDGVMFSGKDAATVASVCRFLDRLPPNGFQVPGKICGASWEITPSTSDNLRILHLCVELIDGNRAHLKMEVRNDGMPTPSFEYLCELVEIPSDQALANPTLFQGRSITVVPCMDKHGNLQVYSLCPNDD